MNKEQIYVKAIEMMLEDKIYIDNYLKRAEKELSKPKLTSKQKGHLEDDLHHLELATKHKYIDITFFDNETSTNFPYVQFGYISKMFNEYRYDTIAGKPCYTQKMESNKKYDLKELL